MVSNFEMILQLILAGILGGLVGLERERKSWYAGLRTHMLVCIGSTLIMIVSQYGFDHIVRQHLVVLDPSRVAAQVVSGIGFLGAGTILFWKNKIKGLTTAASLWAVAAVGLAIGGKLYLAAVITTLLIIITLTLLKRIEKSLFGYSVFRKIKIITEINFSINALDDVLTKVVLLSIDLNIDKIKNKEVVNLDIECRKGFNLFDFIEKIKEIPGVESIEIMN